jgi:hypothetical protein
MKLRTHPLLTLSNFDRKKRIERLGELLYHRSRFKIPEDGK